MSRLNRVVVAAALAVGVTFAGGVVGAKSQPTHSGVCTKVGQVVSLPVPLVCKQTAVRGLRWRKAPTPTTTTTTTTTPIAPSTTVAAVPSVSLATTFLDSGAFPKAAMVTSNVAGTVYFIEGASPVNTVSDITSARYYRWTSGVVAANAPTSIALDVDVLTNGYYRVFVANSQGVLSAPAFNKVTISIPRVSNVAVRTQTLDQNSAAWDAGQWSGIASSQAMAQSFTAGLTGPLSRISLGIYRVSSNTQTQITASIYAASNSGNAEGSALASKTLDATTIPTSEGGALVAFDFVSPVTVTTGTKYVIVVTTPDNPPNYYKWGYIIGNSYAGGTGIVFPLTSPTVLGDLVFKTYVDI